MTAMCGPERLASATDIRVLLPIRRRADDEAWRTKT